MSLKNDMESDIDLFFDDEDFADTGDYTSLVAGKIVTVRYIVDYGARQENDRVDSGSMSTQAKATVPRCDLPSPAKYGDLIEIAGIEWTVVKQIAGDMLAVELELRREPRRKFQK